jgi:hypothetical protein
VEDARKKTVHVQLIHVNKSSCINSIAGVANMEFKCERCNRHHDYKTEFKLKRHENTPSHKRKFDPEFAATEEAEKATKKLTRDEKETGRKAGGKETSRKAGDKEKGRLAARDQSNNNSKRKRSKAEQAEKQRALQKIQYRKQTEKDPAPWVTGDGTEEDALKALVRYHGSTSVAMLLHTDNERIKSNIRKFVRVSPEVKAKIRKVWQEGEMSTKRAHLSCATCGIRDHGNYAEIDVAALPDFFKFGEKDQAMYDVLKGVCFANFVFSIIALTGSQVVLHSWASLAF